MYAVVLSRELHPRLRSVDEAHRFVLGTLVDALGPLGVLAARRGTSDLAVGDRKCSGNSMRAKRRSLLYHGTLLYDFSLPLVAQLLRMPPRRPEYRRDRGHGEFLTNLPLTADALCMALIAGWHANSPAPDWPRRRVEQLVAGRYARAEWNEAR